MGKKVFLILGWLTFVALIGLTLLVGDIRGPQRENSTVVAEAVPSEKSNSIKLTKEQSSIVDYLSQKYNKSREFVELIVLTAYREAVTQGVPPLLVLAIIEKESSLRPEVMSSYGAVGLMQVVPRWHRDKISGEEPIAVLKDPESNIKVGTLILKEYLDAAAGNVDVALKKYSGNARQYAKSVKGFKARMRSMVSSSTLKPDLENH